MIIIKNRRAIIPEIATIILVAVAITIAVTVGYWMGSISRQYIMFENMEMDTHTFVDMTYSVLLTSLKPPDVYAMSLAVVLDTGLIVWKKQKFISTYTPKPLRDFASRLIKPSRKQNDKISKI